MTSGLATPLPPFVIIIIDHGVGKAVVIVDNSYHTSCTEGMVNLFRLPTFVVSTIDVISYD